MTFIPNPTYARNRIVYAGNSIPAGSTLPDRLMRYSDVIQRALDASGRWDNINSSYPGLPTYNPVTEDNYSLIDRYSWGGYPGGTGVFLPAPARSMCVAWEMSNEIRGMAGTTTESALAHWAEFVALLRATGYAPIYSLTPMKRGDNTAAQNQICRRCCEQMVVNAGGIYGDRIIDVGSYPLALDTENRVWFQNDGGIHLTPYAHGVVAQMILNCMMDDHLI